MQESEKPWSPLLQDISALSNIEEQTKIPKKNKIRLHPETDSDLWPQKETPMKKNIRPMKLTVH